MNNETPGLLVHAFSLVDWTDAPKGQERGGQWRATL